MQLDAAADTRNGPGVQLASKPSVSSKNVYVDSTWMLQQQGITLNSEVITPCLGEKESRVLR
jgi:hypothetical protein